MVDSFWVHNINPFVLRFPEGWFTEGIRWYGVAYVVSFAIAALLLQWYEKKGKISINIDQQMTLLTALIVGVFLGGSFGYQLLYDFSRFIHDPLAALRPWEGGMASHGAFVGVIISILWFSWYSARVSCFSVGDWVVTLVPPGLFLGRVANFVNGEVWGKITDVPWAVIFPQSAPRGFPVELIPARHPSQLYEAGLEGLVLGTYLQWRFWRSDVLKRAPGQLAGEFLLAYALLRIVGECFREPDAGLIMSISRGQFYSIFVGIAGLFIVFWRAKAGKTLDLRSANNKGD